MKYLKSFNETVSNEPLVKSYMKSILRDINKVHKLKSGNVN